MLTELLSNVSLRPLHQALNIASRTKPCNVQNKTKLRQRGGAHCQGHAKDQGES